MRMHRWYTPEEIQFVKKNIRGRTYIETLKLFNKRFGLRLSLKQLETMTYKHKIYNGVGKWLPGHIPANKGKTPPGWRGNWKPVGSERLSQGYVWVKVTDIKHRGSKNWKAKHAAIWEKENGRVPKGHVVIFADRNNRNFELDNLMLISRAELSVMNNLGLIANNKELTATGKTIADVKLAVGKRRKKKGAKNAKSKIAPCDNSSRKKTARS
ncbi:MAG: HNH endonuclease [Treponema sp.]|jgi:hypothetical protein|nr:HNH endonuclease [Treponema sp.]